MASLVSKTAPQPHFVYDYFIGVQNNVRGGAQGKHVYDMVLSYIVARKSNKANL